MTTCAHLQPALRTQPADAFARLTDVLLSCSCRVTIASCNSLTVRSHHPKPTRNTNPHPGMTTSSRPGKTGVPAVVRPRGPGTAESCCHTITGQSKSTAKMRQPRKTGLVKQNRSRFQPPANFPRTLSACCQKPTLFSQFQQTSRPSPIHSDSVQPPQH